MSSAQERPAGSAGTTDPTGGNTGTGDMANRGTSAGTGSTSTGVSAGTSGGQRVGAHRGASYEETERWEGRGAAAAVGQGLAGVLLILSGLVTFFYGIFEVIRGSFFTSLPNYAFYFSVRGRGITELVIGAVLFAVGVCLLLGMAWARWVAVALAVLSAIFNFMFLPYYPLWSIVIIALDVFIIWALLHHRSRSMA